MVSVPWNDEFYIFTKIRSKRARCSLNGKLGLVQCDAFALERRVYKIRSKRSERGPMLAERKSGAGICVSSQKTTKQA